MKKLITILFVLLTAAGFSQTYVTKQDVKNDINLRIVPNSTRSITAAQMNKILIGLWDFSEDSTWFSNDTMLTRRGGIIFAKKLPATGVSSSGLTSLNSLTGAAQDFAVDINGTDFNISSSGNTHTFNLPFASAVNSGKLSSADWIRFNQIAEASDSTFQDVYNYFTAAIDSLQPKGVYVTDVVQTGSASARVLFSDSTQRDLVFPFTLTDSTIATLNQYFDSRDSATAKDTIVVESQVLNGTDTIAKVRHDFVNKKDSIAVTIPFSDATHDGLMPKEAWDSIAAHSGGGVESVTGNIVDNTDPANPVVTGIDQAALDDSTAAIRADIPTQLNAIPGTNVTITGSYPNLTFNSSGGGSVTGLYEKQISTAGQTAFTFTTIPADNNKVSFYRNAGLVPRSYYSIVGNVVTFTSGLDDNDTVEEVGVQ
jgi:hypothetical protein